MYIQTVNSQSLSGWITKDWINQETSRVHQNRLRLDFSHYYILTCFLSTLGYQLPKYLIYSYHSRSNAVLIMKTLVCLPLPMRQLGVFYLTSRCECMWLCIGMMKGVTVTYQDTKHSNIRWSIMTLGFTWWWSMVFSYDSTNAYISKSVEDYQTNLYKLLWTLKKEYVNQQQ